MARIKWTDELRLGLDILKADTKLDTATKVTIFAKAFDDHLKRCGMPKITWGKLSAQYQEKGRQAKSRAWLVCTVESPENAVRRDGLQARLRTVAQELSLRAEDEDERNALSPLTPPSSGPSRGDASLKKAPSLTERGKGRPRTSTTPPSQSTPTKRNSSSLSSSEDESSPLVQTPTKKRRVAYAVTPQRQAMLKNVDRQVSLKVWHQINADKGAWISPTTKLESERPLIYPEDAHQKHDGLLYRAWDHRYGILTSKSVT